MMILLGLLIPLLLMGDLVSDNPFARFDQAAALRSAGRPWRLNQVLEEHYYLNQWMVYGRFDYCYDHDLTTRLDSVVFSIWGGGNPNDFTPAQTIHYTYDGTNEYVSTALLTMNMGTMIYPMQRGTYTYDSQHRLIMLLVEWNSSMMDPQWSTTRWTKISYVNNADYTVCNYTAANSTDPQMWERQSFTWDAQGRVLTELSQASPDSVNWTNHSLISRTFHPDDNTTGDIFVHNLTQWLPFETMGYDFLFNGSGTMFGLASQEIEQEWDAADWVNASLRQYTYNGFLKLSQALEQSWNPGSSGWMDYLSYDYTYYDNQNLRYETHSEFNTINLEWDPHYRYTCTWGNATANADDNASAVIAQHLTVSPNPFSGQVTLCLPGRVSQPVKLAIYNNKGQLVKTLDAKTNLGCNWDGKDARGGIAADGVYLIKAVTPEAVITGKVLKLK